MRSERWIVVAVVACYAALYGRAAGYEFVWDDVPEIARAGAFDGSLLDGLRMTQAERIDPALVRTRGVVLAYDSYRPVLFASYWLEIHAWGRRPGPMHITNVVIGAIGILLAHALARRLLAPPHAVAATAIFALHPLHVEAIAYISGRGDLIAGVLVLAAAVLSVRALGAATRAGRIGWTAGAALAFALSLLAKESCIGLPVALVALGWTLGARWRAAWIPAVLAGVAACVMALRAMVIASSSSLALGGALAQLPAVYLDDARSVLLPLDLAPDRPLAEAYLVPAWILGGIAALVALAVVVRRGWPARLAPAIAGLIWWAVLIAPSGVAILSTGVMSDRYVYTPLFGVAVALVAAIAALVRARSALRRPILGVAALWAALLGFVAWRQVAVWSDDLALNTHAVAATPESGAAHWRLGTLHAQAGRWDDAIVELQAAAELDPDNFHALDNLGVALISRQRYAEAEAALVRAVAASPPPSSFRPLFNLGVARLARGDRAGGCAAIRRALGIKPGYAAAAAELARSCRR